MDLHYTSDKYTWHFLAYSGFFNKKNYSIINNLISQYHKLISNSINYII